MSYINIETVKLGCPECGHNIFENPLSFSFEAIDGYKQENGLFEFTFTSDSQLNLKLSDEKTFKFVQDMETKIYNDFGMCDEWKEVNLLEYKFSCSNCNKNIVAYNFDPEEDFDLGDLDTQINFSEYKSVWYNKKIHKEKIISLSLNELIQNTKNDLLCKQFLVKGILVVHDSTFKHRGGTEETTAEYYDDMIYKAESSDNIEHGVQGLERTIVYTSINIID